MIRAFLLGFLAGPLPFVIWSTALQRAARPDTLAQVLGGVAASVPLTWLLARLVRRPAWLLLWFATAGTVFWAAVRHAVRNAEGAGEAALLVGLFPVTGTRALLAEGLMLFPVLLFLWGTIAGFAAILHRSHAPVRERPARREDAAGEEEEAEATPPPGRPPFVERPPPKPKGPAQTPRTREDTPPPQTRVPGK